MKKEMTKMMKVTQFMNQIKFSNRMGVEDFKKIIRTDRFMIIFLQIINYL